MDQPFLYAKKRDTQMGFGIIGRGQIIEKWGTLISGAAGRGESLLTDTRRLIQESHALDVRVRRRGMSTGVVRGIMGGKRSFLIVTNTGNRNLELFKIYLNAKDYGSNLQVSWYVVLQPNGAERLMAFCLSIPLFGLLFLPFHLLGRLFHANKYGILELDIFDEQDLAAYVTNVHHCMLDVVEELMRGLKQDFYRVERQSQGILGIS